MKVLKALSGFLLILLAAPTSPLQAQPAPSQAPANSPSSGGGSQQISQRDLQEYVSELSKELPMTLEKSIRWDSIALAPSRVLIYKYTFLDSKVQNINAQQTAQIKRSVVEAMCGNPDVKILLDNDVNFNFKYHTAQGKFLTEVQFNRGDCR